MALLVSKQDFLQKSRHCDFLWEDELEDLAHENSNFAFYIEQMQVSESFLSHQSKKTDRRGEVSLFICNHKGDLLMHDKPFYPPEVKRVPTGGIHLEEMAIAAMKRELYEETGFHAETFTPVALLLYEFICRDENFCFPSYLFHIRTHNEEPRVMDKSEQIGSFEWLPKSQLGRVIYILNNLRAPSWMDWGRFRSVPHEIMVDHPTNVAL